LRPTGWAVQAENEVGTRTYDLVLAEDMGRIFRRVHAQLFCESCEDCDTRLIALNNHIDTAQDNWRVFKKFSGKVKKGQNSNVKPWGVIG
jgi:hypothetical protein